MNFKVDQVLLFSWKSWPGKVIQFHNILANGIKKDWKWTHAAIIGEVKENSVIVYEAINKGFSKKEYGKGELESYIKSGNCCLGESYIKLSKVKENSEKYLGTPYGWIDIFSIGLYLFLGKFSFSINTKTKYLICSEAVARILYDSSNKKIDFEKEYKKRYDLITPQDLKLSSQIKWD